MDSLEELQREVKDGSAAFEQLREEWRLGRKEVTEQILATTDTLTLDAFPPVTLRHFLNTRIATDRAPSHISQAMAALGIEPHLGRLEAFKERLSTLGVSTTALYKLLANDMELRLPESCQKCANTTLADRWLHANHGRYNRALKDIIEEHNYRPRFRNVLQRDGQRSPVIVGQLRRFELATFLYANMDSAWYLPTPA